MVILFEQEFKGSLTWKCDRVNGGRLSSSPCESEGTVFDLRWDIWSWNSPNFILIKRRRDSQTSVYFQHLPRAAVSADQAKQKHTWFYEEPDPQHTDTSVNNNL